MSVVLSFVIIERVSRSSVLAFRMQDVINFTERRVMSVLPGWMVITTAFRNVRLFKFVAIERRVPGWSSFRIVPVLLLECCIVLD